MRRGIYLLAAGLVLSSALPAAEPDATIEIGSVVSELQFKNSVLPYVFPQDTWVQKIEILPDNSDVVHHANLIAFQMDKGIRSAYFVTGKVPGANAGRCVIL